MKQKRYKEWAQRKIEFTTQDPDQLYKLMVKRYKWCKARKLDERDEPWAVWSGAFNRHCKGFTKGMPTGPHKDRFIYLFQMWVELNTILRLHKSIVPSAKKQKAARERFELRLELFNNPNAGKE